MAWARLSAKQGKDPRTPFRKHRHGKPVPQQGGANRSIGVAGFDSPRSPRLQVVNGVSGPAQSR